MHARSLVLLSSQHFWHANTECRAESLGTEPRWCGQSVMAVNAQQVGESRGIPPGKVRHSEIAYA